MADRTRRFRHPLRPILVFVAMTLVLASCGGGDDTGGNGGNGGDNPGAEPGNEAQAIFVNVGCAECHGEQAEGIEGEGSALQGTRMIFSAFETRVRNGCGEQMPAFSQEEISDEEVQMLYDWLRNQ